MSADNIFLTIDDLATLLRRPKATILNDRVRNPNSLPKSFTLPGTKHVLYRREDVIEWINSLVERTPAPGQPPAAPRRGRPPSPKGN